jgi:TPR repeat protein
MAEYGAGANLLKPSVFISYSRENLDFADQLDTALLACGFSCLRDQRAISPGEDWRIRLAAMIRVSDCVVFVLTAASARSPECLREYEQAKELKKRILPVVPGGSRELVGVKPPEGLDTINYVFFHGEPEQEQSGWGKGLKRLVDALNTDIDWLHEHTRYLQKATEWERSGRKPNKLLFDDDVAAAKDWAVQQPSNALGLTGLQREFIQASDEEDKAKKNAERQQIKDREEMVGAKEAAVKQKEDAVKQKEEEVKKREKTERVRNVMAVLTCFGFVVAFGFAVSFRNILGHAQDIIGQVRFNMDEQAQASALGIFKEAEYFGDVASIRWVGVGYRNGWGTRRNYSEAVWAFRFAAFLGDTEAMDNLGSIYESGEGKEQGIAQDYLEAYNWYKKAADKGDQNAMNNLGRLYYDGHYDGQEDVQDRQKASEWFRRAAGVSEHETCTLLPEPTRSSAHSGPVPDALYNLGRLYDDRERNGNAANAAEARCWYEMAAIAGHTAAMLKLGSIYEAGRGVEQNVAEAIKWYEKAAKNKDMEGMFNLAALSEAGRGIAPDRGGALIWYARAAGDDMKAEFDPYGVGSALKVGAFFENGFCAPPDPAEARAWRERAGKMGDEGVRAHLRSPSKETVADDLK